MVTINQPFNLILSPAIIWEDSYSMVRHQSNHSPSYSNREYISIYPPTPSPSIHTYSFFKYYNDTKRSNHKRHTIAKCIISLLLLNRGMTSSFSKGCLYICTSHLILSVCSAPNYSFKEPNLTKECEILEAMV